MKGAPLNPRRYGGSGSRRRVHMTTDSRFLAPKCTPRFKPRTPARRKYQRRHLAHSVIGPTKMRNRGTGQFRMPDLSRHNRQSARKFHRKKKFNSESPLIPPSAPHNTTSFIIRNKKTDGIGSRFSPVYPDTPTSLCGTAVSPGRDVLVHSGNEEPAANGHGSTNSVFRTRPSLGANGNEGVGSEAAGDGGNRRDLSRLETDCRCRNVEGSIVWESRGVDWQEKRIAELGLETVTLKERLVSMESELQGLLLRLQKLEDGHENYGLGIDAGNSRPVKK